jgi:hypothetical protein
MNAAIGTARGEGHVSCRRCLWCGAELNVLRKRGSARRFCSAGHKQTFWSALHRHAWAEFEAGRTTVDMLRAVEQSVHAFQSQLGGARAPGPNLGDQNVSEIGRASSDVSSGATAGEARVGGSMPPLVQSAMNAADGSGMSTPAAKMERQ